MKLLIVFIVCNIINVIIQTVKSLVTIKGNKWQAAIINALAYGFYTYIVILMVCELDTFAKCLIVGGANLVGVYAVKAIEEKKQRTKLWKIELNTTFSEQVTRVLETIGVSYNAIQTNKGDTTFNIFAKTKDETKAVKEIIKKYHCKYFISEAKYNF
jgi:uncharacterized protein YebE (UPF0316 family)